MKRLYYLTRNIESTESISKDLHAAGITDWNFHVLSKNEAGLYRRQIHSANTFHKSDLIHGAERGAIYGLAAGLFLALVLWAGSAVSSSIALLATVIFSTLFGAWLGGFIGIQRENYKIKRFHDQIERGHYLIMVDIDVGQELMVRGIMSKRHPEAHIAGVDSSIILPFDSHTNYSAN